MYVTISTIFCDNWPYNGKFFAIVSPSLTFKLTYLYLLPHPSTILNLAAVAKCCSIFSVTGFFFLIVIGILLQKQPLYMKGPKDPAKAAMGCYEGGTAVRIACFSAYPADKIWFFRLIWRFHHFSFLHRSCDIPSDVYPFHDVLDFWWVTAGKSTVLR